MRLAFTKWDGRAHWYFDIDELGDDEHGRWFHVPPGRILRRGTETIHRVGRVGQGAFGYPPDVIQTVRATADRLLSLVDERIEPFGEVAESWVARAIDAWATPPGR